MSADELTSLRARVLVVEGALEHATETLARHIYNGWGHQTGWVPWVPHGNSLRQDDARREAHSVLQGLSQDQGREGYGSSVAESGGTASPKSDGQGSAGPFSFEAQLAECLADPEWVAKWNASEDERRPLTAMLSALRADEGDSITLLSDNPDFNGQPNNAVECCGAWTDWEDRRFTGDTIHAAVLAAYRARFPADHNAGQPNAEGVSTAAQATEEPPSSIPQQRGGAE